MKVLNDMPPLPRKRNHARYDGKFQQWHVSDFEGIGLTGAVLEYEMKSIDK